MIRTIEATELGPILKSLKIRGRDLGEGLDRYGCLLTPERIREIQAQVLEEIADLMSRTAAHQWSRGYGNTQNDLMHGITDNLRQMADDRRNQHVR